MIRGDRLATTAVAFIGLLASLSAGLLFVGGTRPTAATSGAIAMLLALSMAGPSLGGAIESCEVSAAGTVGKLVGIRAAALQLAIYLVLGLPLSLGFWAWKAIVSSAVDPRGAAGVRQAAVAIAATALFAGALKFLAHWSSLRSRPPLPPLDDESWLVVGSLYGSFVLMAAGVWPAPVFAVLDELLVAAGVK
jgi:hypothetical protein